VPAATSPLYVLVVHDEPRYLGRSLGYSPFPTRVDPIECISESDQAQQTRDAHRRWRAEQARAWGRAHATITNALHEFAASARDTDRRITSDIRVIERTARRIDERVAL
jgi:hypothetical protein